MKSVEKFVVKAFNLMSDNDVNNWIKTLIKIKNNIENDFNLLDLCDLIMFY